MSSRSLALWPGDRTCNPGTACVYVNRENDPSLAGSSANARRNAARIMRGLEQVIRNRLQMAGTAIFCLGDLMSGNNFEAAGAPMNLA